MRIRALLLSLLMAALTGCAGTQTQYYWGNYENLVYLMYAQPGEATPEVQIERLTTDRQKAEAAGLPVPPGVNAHMGMMYAALGNIEQALAAFEEEKRLYPESAKFMDDMISRATGGKKS